MHFLNPEVPSIRRGIGQPKTLLQQFFIRRYLQMPTTTTTVTSASAAGTTTTVTTTEATPEDLGFSYDGTFSSWYVHADC